MLICQTPVWFATDIGLLSWAKTAKSMVGIQRSSLDTPHTHADISKDTDHFRCLKLRIIDQIPILAQCRPDENLHMVDLELMVTYRNPSFFRWHEYFPNIPSWMGQIRFCGVYSIAALGFPWHVEIHWWGVYSYPCADYLKCIDTLFRCCST